MRTAAGCAIFVLFASMAFGADWEAYASPEQAGFSSKKLNRARKTFEASGAQAAMIVHRGAVVASWGDVERRLDCHDVGSSLLMSLIGIRVGNGSLDPNATLSTFGIRENDRRFEYHIEQARVMDLLGGCSGVHHAAANESLGLKGRRLQNPDHAPGQARCYNTWDRNALIAVLERSSGRGFFDELAEKLAEPIGMQDYRPTDGYHVRQENISALAASPLRVSTRDLARFGLLILQRGRWGDRQIVPEAWVDTGAGWLADQRLRRRSMLSALGAGHAVDIVPSIDLVFVYRGNPERAWHGATGERLQLLKRILDARTGNAPELPDLVPLAPVSRGWTPAAIPPEVLDRFVGNYPLGFTSVTIRRDGGHLTLDSGQGRFDLVPVDEAEFIAPDLDERVYFHRDESGEPFTLVMESLIERKAQAESLLGRMDRAIELFRLNCRYYPDSFRAHDNLAEALIFSGKPELAMKSVRASLKLNPSGTFANYAVLVLQRTLSAQAKRPDGSTDAE